MMQDEWYFDKLDTFFESIVTRWNFYIFLQKYFFLVLDSK